MTLTIAARTLVAASLLLSAATHLWAGDLGQTLDEHQVVPTAWRRQVAALVPLALGLTGCAVVVGMFVAAVGRASLVVSAALFLALSMYVRTAARSARFEEVECGCGVLDGPLTRHAFLRPAAMAGVSAVAVALRSQTMMFPRDLMWVGAGLVAWTALFSLLEARMAAARWMRDLRAAHGLRVEV